MLRVGIGNDLRFPGPRPGLVWPLRLDPEGVRGPTRHQASGPNWIRVSQGFYVPAWVDQSPEQRIVQAAAVLPAYGGITGWAALRWAGAHWFTGQQSDGSHLPVPLATSGHDIRAQAGFTVSALGLDPAHLWELDHLALTSPTFAVFYEMCRARDVRDAVRIVDMTAYNDLSSIAEVAELASIIGPKTGIAQVREALELGDENAWSPKEVDMRLVWTLDALLPRPLCNVPIFDRGGNHIGTPDLFEPAAGVVGEYDGALHLEGAQRSRDVRREEVFRRHGLEYFTMLAGDSADPTNVIGRMQGAYHRARHLPEASRSWTIEPPNWWTPTMTVAQRRSLAPELRERVLARRLRAS